MAKKESNLASVLSFEKKLVLSDGYMYGTTWEKRNETARPVMLVEKSVRGTISNRLKDSVKNDPMKLNAEVEKANLQTVDSTSISLNDDTLKLSFTIKVLSGVEHPSACNNETHHKKIEEIGKKFIARVRIRINLQRSARTGFICRIWRFFFRGVLQLII